MTETLKLISHNAQVEGVLGCKVKFLLRLSNWRIILVALPLQVILLAATHPFSLVRKWLLALSALHPVREALVRKKKKVPQG
jgi:hypothetical protein